MAITAKRNHHLTVGQVAKEIHVSIGSTISRQTVSMSLNNIVLYPYKPVKCIPSAVGPQQVNAININGVVITQTEPTSNGAMLSSRTKADLVSRPILAANTSDVNTGLPLSPKILLKFINTDLE